MKPNTTQTPEDINQMIYDSADDGYRAAVDRMEDIDTIKIGVCNSNTPEWIYEDTYDAIDPGYEEYIINNPDDEYGEEYYDDAPTHLIGFIRSKTLGEYETDQNAEYSAIVSEVYTQIIKSKYISLCAYCSPCYPDQGDLDTAGHIKAYTLPPDVWGDADHLEIEEI
jgi:hypothetical protein